MPTAPPISSVAQTSADLRQACLRISRRLRFERSVGIPPHQLSALRGLSQGLRTPSELAGRDRVSAPSMTRTVAALVDAGLVSRSDDPSDGRQVLLTLTAAGARLLVDIQEQRDEWMQWRVAQLDPEEQRALTQAAPILMKLADSE